MGNVLAFCEFTEEGLRSSALANLAFARTAAQAHGGEVIAVLIGAGAKAVGPAAAKYAPTVVVVGAPAAASHAGLGVEYRFTTAPDTNAPMK